MTTSEAYNAFDEWLACEYTVKIIDVYYDPATVLFAIDPIAYRCYFNDWADGEGINIDELEGDLYRH